MSKIMINGGVFSKNDEELIDNVKAVYKDNVIAYNLNGITIKITTFPDKLLITRENDDMKLNLEFEENKRLVSKYLIKDLGLNVKVEYDLFMNEEFSDSFTFNLEWSDL